MPRTTTDKVIERQRHILEFVKNEICVTTQQVIQTFGLTHSQVFYVLQLLKNQGVIEEYIIGKLSLWCVAGHVMNDVYVGDAFIPIASLERAICALLENARGHRATIRPSRIVDEIASQVHIKTRHPLILAYVSEMLPIMMSNVDKTLLKDSRNLKFYVVDTCSICEHFSECLACETLRKKLNC